MDGFIANVMLIPVKRGCRLLSALFLSLFLTGIGPSSPVGSYSLSAGPSVIPSTFPSFIYSVTPSTASTDILRQVIPRQANTGQNGQFRLARIQYSGGGDWYNDPSALRNLISYIRQVVPVSISETYDDVQIGSSTIHNYPFAFMTGHGVITATESEVTNLRTWLDNGGFLYIDDDYGLDTTTRQLISRIYPDEALVELPFEHPIYHQVYPMPDGLPKVHEHEGQPPQGLAIFREGKMVIFYSYESNLSDGWAYDVHENPQAVTDAALQMGVNLLVYALTAAP